MSADVGHRHDLVLAGARLVVTVDSERTEVPGGWVAVDGGVIAAVGPTGHEPPAARTGLAPVRELLDAGVPVGVGCDGSASTDSASMWMETRAALLLGRLRGGPTAMQAREALELATLGGARCLGRSGAIGQLTPGAAADVVVWPLEGVQHAGAWADPVEALLRCGPNAARHTIVNGEFVVRDGRLVDTRVGEMLQRHEAVARRWQELA